ncbi:hypothetical protein F0562_024852 [Nyssa sinensis]|uniref:Uncharacterized protein n=1 Tax=Nyssa sinensis TaxID=561372 RepID=A0A5J5BFF7_9ASTE|nr:hypothetical protein F0562_024852 [Nyssa sinensis]
MMPILPIPLAVISKGSRVRDSVCFLQLTGQISISLGICCFVWCRLLFEVNMVQKRPFGDEELYEVSSKHPRQLEYSNQLVSVLEFVPSDNATQKPKTSGEGFAKSKTDDDEKISTHIITGLPVCSEKDIETSAPGCISNSSWATSINREEDARSKAPPLHLLFSPEYYNLDHPLSRLVYSEEIFPSVWEYPPRKLVSIGPEFQADVPEWRPRVTKSMANCSDLSDPSNLSPQASESSLVDNSGETNLAGICVIPSHESEPSSYSSDKVGDGRI